MSLTEFPFKDTVRLIGVSGSLIPLIFHFQHKDIKAQQLIKQVIFVF